MKTTVTPQKLADSELDDLISSDKHQGHDYNDHSGSNGDNSKHDNNKLSSYYSYNDDYSTSGTRTGSIITKIPSLVVYMCMSFLLHYPRCSKLLTILLLTSLFILLLSLTNQGKTVAIGNIGYDFTQIHSQYDFDIGKINHWCIDYSDNCQCADPLSPTPRPSKEWFKSHRAFTNIIDNDTKNNNDIENKIDVVFLGQSVVEAFNGKHNSQDMVESSDYFGHIQHMFQNRFNNPNKANHYIKGLAMGLAGDQANNILWRLRNGELNDNFDPPFWWIVIGMEDLARYRCSEEIVVMGVLRIVEEIKKFKPHAKIIINGLFPMTALRSEEPEPLDFVDSERVNDRHHQRRLGQMKDKKERQFERSKQFKAAMAQRLNEKFDAIQKKNRAKETEIRTQIQEIKRNKDIKLKEKKDAIAEMKDKLQSLQQSHEKMEKAILEYTNNIKRDKLNPEMKEDHTFHKDNLFHHHKQRQIPVWTAIHAINNELHNFCKRTERVTFYDPTELFTERNGVHTILLTEYMSPRGHPTQEGYKLWLNDIQVQLMKWKEKNDAAAAKLNSSSNNVLANTLSSITTGGDNTKNDLDYMDDVWSSALSKEYYNQEEKYYQIEDEEDNKGTGSDEGDESDDGVKEAEEEVIDEIGEVKAYDDDTSNFDGDDDWVEEEVVDDDEAYYVDDELDDFKSRGGDDEGIVDADDY